MTVRDAGSRNPLLAGVLIAASAATAAAVWIGAQHAARTFLSLDLLHFFYPAHAYVGRELAEGRVPVWNPYVGFGASAVADPQLGIWYPPNLLYAVLPTSVALDVLAWFHVALAAAGAYLLCRAAAIGVAGAAVGAVAVATGAPLQTLTSWPAILATFAWCPVAMAAGWWLAGAPGFARTLILAGVLALQILAGYFQLHLYTLCVVALFAISRTAGTPASWSRVLVWLAMAEAIALLLTAVQVLPSMAAVPWSIRSRAFLQPSSYEIFHVRLEHYWRSLAMPARDGMAPIYAGSLAPLLALAALLPVGRRVPLRRAVFVLLVVAVVLSLGSATPIFPLLWKTPIGHWFTGPYKWTVMAGLAIPLAAAIGTELLLGADSPRWAARLVWVLVGAILLAFVPFSTGARFAGVLGLAVVLAGGRVARIAVPVAVGVASLAGFNERPLRPHDDPAMFSRYHAAYEAMASRDDRPRVFAFVPGLAFPMRQGELERVPTFNSYETLIPIRRFRLAGAISEALQSPERRGQGLAALRAIGVRYLLTAHDGQPWLQASGLHRVFASSTADVWEDPAALPRLYLAQRAYLGPESDALAGLFDPAVAADEAVVLEDADGPSPSTTAGGTVRLVRDDTAEMRLAVDLPAPAVLVLLDAWSPEWRAMVDGAPTAIRHGNYFGRAVELPAGRHEVIFQFWSRPFRLGAIITLLALATYVPMLWWHAGRRRVPVAGRHRGPPPSGSPAVR